MQLLLMCADDEIYLLPTIQVLIGECDCCGEPTVEISLVWLWFGIGLRFRSSGH